MCSYNNLSFTYIGTNTNSAANLLAISACKEGVMTSFSAPFPFDFYKCIVGDVRSELVVCFAHLNDPFIV